MSFLLYNIQEDEKMGVGQQLKALRKANNITISEVAEKTELSVGFLSNLERDQTSPTIDVLHKICNALNITLNDVLNIDGKNNQDTENTNHVNVDESIVRVDDRRLIFREDNGGLSYSSMTKGKTDFKVSAMSINDDKLHVFAKHDHDELGIIVAGSLELQIEGRSHYLYPGDSIYIKADTMHAGKKFSEEPCLSYWTKLSTELNDIKRNTSIRK